MFNTVFEGVIDVALAMVSALNPSIPESEGDAFHSSEPIGTLGSSG
jgi:hypothetical protein